MIFSKPALTIDAQVALLQSRGMGGDASRIRRRLMAVSYYRLSAYWHTFKRPDDSFVPNTHIDVVWDRYIFDRALRVLVMDAVERFEVATRSRIAHLLARRYGPLGYAEDPAALFPNAPDRQSDFFAHLRVDLRQQRDEPFIKHFVRTYGDAHEFPPIWVAIEVMGFGGTVSLYRGCDGAIRREVADAFGVAPEVFTSWLLTLNLARNVCAHHGRLWNRELANKPKIPRYPAWQTPVPVGNERVFAVLTLLAHAVQRIAPHSGWAGRVRALLDKHPEVPRNQMGFPASWEQCVIWRRAWREIS